MKEFYDNNMDFRNYVDKYCRMYGYTLEEALEHELVKEVYKYYAEVQGEFKVSSR